MRACTMNKRSRLKNANLIFISCSYFSCVSTAIQTTDSYVVMYSSRYYLNSFEITGQNYYITTSCICLQQFIPLSENCFPSNSPSMSGVGTYVHIQFSILYTCQQWIVDKRWHPVSSMLNIVLSYHLDEKIILRIFLIGIIICDLYFTVSYASI